MSIAWRVRNYPEYAIGLTPARELGLDLGPLDYTAAAWNVPQDTTSTQDAMDSDEDSFYNMILYTIL